MGKQIYFLTGSTSNKIEISWQSFIFNAFKRNIVIQLDGQVLDSTVQQIELEKGKTYSLSDGSTLAVSLNPNDLEVRHNGQVVEPYQDIDALLSTTLTVFLLFGLGFVFLGIADLWPIGVEGIGAGYKLAEIFLGLIILLLGYLIYKTKSLLVLQSAFLIVVLHALIFDIYVPITTENESFHLTNIWVGIILLSLIYQSIKALGKPSVNNNIASSFEKRTHKQV